MGRSKASLSTKINLACDALGNPLGFLLTGANVSDYDQCKPLLRAHFKPQAYAITDKDYDSDALPVSRPHSRSARCLSGSGSRYTARLFLPRPQLEGNWPRRRPNIVEACRCL